ncbi:MAG: AsmA-like C-terminal domain-containing protein [Magnetococcales bacterium]|nr:AsmA-like C-terminal domain-containing protein [Magnetococcales bacterium]
MTQTSKMDDASSSTHASDLENEGRTSPQAGQKSRVAALMIKMVNGLGYLLGVVLLSAVGAVIWLTVYPLSLDDYASDVSGFLSGPSGLTVRLDTLFLEMGAVWALSGHGLTVLDQDGKNHLFDAESVRIQFALKPWLNGGRPFKVGLSGVNLLVRRDEEGNFHLGNKKFQVKDNTGSEVGLEPDLLPFSVLSMDNSDLLWIDEHEKDSSENGVEYHLTNLKTTGYHAPQQGWQFTLAGLLETQNNISNIYIKLSRDLQEVWHSEASLKEVKITEFLPYTGNVPPLDGLRFPMDIDLTAKWGKSQHPEIEWKLAVGKGDLNWPTLFRWPIPITWLKSHGEVIVGEEDWRLNVAAFEFESSHGWGKGDLTLDRFNDPKGPFLDLNADAGGTLTKQAPYYYPVAIMAPELVEWLDNALKRGRVNKANARIRGLVGNIPFDDAPTQGPDAAYFRFTGDVVGASVFYYSGLPPISEVKTHLLFDRSSMTAQVADGFLADSRSVHGTVTIPDMVDDPHVVIDARAQASMASLWQDLVAAKSLRWDKDIGLNGSEIHGFGPAHFKMDLPIWRLDDTRFHGTLDFTGSTVKLPFLDIPFIGLNGHLKLDDKKLSVSILDGIFEEVPINGIVRVRDYRNPPKARMDLQVAGQVIDEQLQPLLDPFLSDDGLLSGSAELTLEMIRGSGQSDFGIEATLDSRFLGVAGVGGWKKHMGAPGFLNLDARMDLQGRLNIQRLTGKMGNARIRGRGQWRLHEGTGQMRLDPISINDNSVTVDIKRIKNATDSSNDWAVLAQANTLNLPTLFPKITDEKTDKAKSADIGHNATLWPRVWWHFEADQIKMYNNIEAKRFVAEGGFSERRFSIDKLTFEQGQDKKQTLETRVQWENMPGEGAYQGRVNITSQDWGAWLKGLDIHDGIEGGHGALSMNLKGSVPAGMRLSDRVSGTGNLEINKGEIRRFQLLSKLLGLLSLAELPRLLILDRPDLTKEGFFFDTLSMPIKINNSVVMADGFEMVGPSMKVVASGNASVPADKLDLLVGVRPLQTLDEILTKLPVLGQILGGSREAILETQFDVSGKLNDPQVVLKPMASLAPGILKDLISIPGKLINKAKEKKNPEEGVGKWDFSVVKPSSEDQE